MKKTPIEVFSQWAKDGRDHGMENNHRASVENMLDYSTNKITDFTFIDAGCGNGWVVRKVASMPQCKVATGIDGSQEMIEKAKKNDPVNDYFCDDLMRWNPKDKVDLVHSMEVFYYFKEPEQLIKKIYSDWLKNGARLIIGLDFYFENKVSHSWPEDCGIATMQLYTEKTWIEFFKKSGFKEVTTWRVGEKEGWAGTLILTGHK